MKSDSKQFISVIEIEVEMFANTVSSVCLKVFNSKKIAFVEVSRDFFNIYSLLEGSE